MTRTGLEPQRDGALLRKLPIGRDPWLLRVARTAGMPLGVTTVPGRHDPDPDPDPEELVLDTPDGTFHRRCETAPWITVAFPNDLTPGLARLERTCAGPLRHAAGAVLRDFVLSLAAQLPHVAAADLPPLARVARAMIAATLEDPPSSPAATCVLRARVDRLILENVTSARLGPARIAQLAGVSRSTLYRLLEREGGVAAHVKRLRLEGVRADLADPARARDPIFRIAERWGFYSASAFSRSFRAEFGMSPSGVRGPASLVAR